MNMTLPLGHASAKAPTKGAKHHVKERKHGHQGRSLPFWRAVGSLEQFHRRDKERVVGQRAEELRRHDGEKAFFHAVLNRWTQRKKALEKKGRRA
jgi:hypothetical protein